MYSRNNTCSAAAIAVRTDAGIALTVSIKKAGASKRNQTIKKTEMFGLFGKKKKKYFASRVMSSRENLDRFLCDGIKRGEFVVVAFFEETRQKISDALPEELREKVIIAEQVAAGFAISRIKTFLSHPDRKLVFAERYPLSAREEQCAERLSQENIPLPIMMYASLDDAFFHAFGGERLKGLMQTLGLDENEFIEHAMIEKSIENAQEKIAKKISVESHARSGKEWFRMNNIGKE